MLALFAFIAEFLLGFVVYLVPLGQISFWLASIYHKINALTVLALLSFILSMVLFWCLTWRKKEADR